MHTFRVPCANGVNHTEFIYGSNRLDNGEYLVTFFPAFNFTLPSVETRQEITNAINQAAKDAGVTAIFAFDFNG